MSIITPSLNQARYLDQTINSVLSQGYDRLEYIIMDGGSTDGSIDIIRRYSDRLAYWVSERDSGQVDAIVRGMQQSTGDIVAYLNSDDYYLEGAIVTAVQSFAEQPSPGFVYGAGLVVDERGGEVGRVPARDFDIDALVFGAMPIVQPSAFFLRDALWRVGPFSTDMEYVFDWDMFIRIGRRFGGVATPAVLAAARDYPTTKTNTGSFGRLEEIRRLVERHTGQPFTVGYLHYYMWELQRALASLGFGERSRLHWEVRLIQLALTEMIEENQFLHRVGAGAPTARHVQREQDLLAQLVDRDTEIGRLTHVVTESVGVRDREIARLQSVLAEEVEVRDRGIARLQSALAEETEVRDRGIVRLQSAFAEETEVRDRGIVRLQSALAEETEVRDRAIARLQSALAEETEVRDREIFRLQSVLAGGVTSAPPVNVVYAYHEHCDGFDNQGVIDLWKESWSAWGWTPVILGPDDAMRYASIEGYLRAVEKLPTVNPPGYDLACYKRWVAMVARGGGLLTDYDVMNYGFTPEMAGADTAAYPDTLIFFEDRVPSAVFGNEDAFAFAVRVIEKAEPGPQDVSNGRPHLSDMTILQRVWGAPWLRYVPHVVQWSVPGWREARLVHYPYDRIRGPKPPRIKERYPFR